MTIQIGDRIPAATLAQATADGPKPVSTAEIFNGKTVALFAVPGAFTPTCSARHLPGFKDHLADIQGKGVDTVACISVNDAFVMKAWAESQGITDDSIVMLADGNGDLTRALGLVADAAGLVAAGALLRGRPSRRRSSSTTAPTAWPPFRPAPLPASTRRTSSA